MKSSRVVSAEVTTRGEITHNQLSRRGDRGDGEDIHPAFTSLGDACLHFTWSSRGAVGIEGLSLSTVTSPAEADFILAHGTECVNGPGSAESSDEERAAGAVDTPLEAMREMLVEAADRGLPMVVANPDVVTVGGGALKPMPGTLAKWYEEMGGEVHLMGKPAPIIYERVMEMTGGASPYPSALVTRLCSLSHFRFPRTCVAGELFVRSRLIVDYAQCDRLTHPVCL